MQKSDFWFDLPQGLIAQIPISQRDSSRLLCLDKDSQSISHTHFSSIIDYLHSGDLLVLNNSRVLPARLYGTKKDTGAKIEVLLLEQKEGSTWEAMVKPGKKAKVGTQFIFGDGLLNGVVSAIVEGGNRRIEFTYKGNFYEILDKIGQMPLPHYITEKLQDNERYQTVYAKEIGSCAAPTAGLHFTTQLLDNIKAKGVQVAFVTLHVGLGTFRPVKTDNILEHKMHAEHYAISQETADLINQTKQNGGRVIAVGTTSCRTLETVASQGTISQCEGYTDIFIFPGYTFKVVDALITNFHLPESTLIMLVSALAGYDTTMRAYKEAVEQEYYFFSFGDAMFIK